MYTAVLVLALATGSDSIDHGGRRGGCNGGGYCSGYGGGYCGGGGYYGGGGYCCSGGGVYRSGYYNPGMYYGSSYPMPMYYNSGAIVQNGGVYDSRQSFYFDPNTNGGIQNSARVMVVVPNPEAEIWFDGNATQQRGFERFFESSTPLDPNSRYQYSVKARWLQDGKAVERQQTVDVRAGQPATVDFRAQGSTGERVPLPRDPNTPRTTDPNITNPNPANPNPPSTTPKTNPIPKTTPPQNP